MWTHSKRFSYKLVVIASLRYATLAHESFHNIGMYWGPAYSRYVLGGAILHWGPPHTCPCRYSLDPLNTQVDMLPLHTLPRGIKATMQEGSFQKHGVPLAAATSWPWVPLN